MRRKRVKGYWLKRKENFVTGTEAKARAGYLREYNEVQHVVVERVEDGYLVKYSIAKWYQEQLEELGIRL